jgi:threonine/homoserine/homoserine lactone efflux protein
MTQPPMVPQPAPAAKDNTTLFGVLGIVFGLCCWPLGVVFAVLSHLQANKLGKPATLAIVGYVVAGLSLIGGIAYYANR